MCTVEDELSKIQSSEEATSASEPIYAEINPKLGDNEKREDDAANELRWTEKGSNILANNCKGGHKIQTLHGNIHKKKDMKYSKFDTST